MQNKHRRSIAKVIDSFIAYPTRPTCRGAFTRPKKEKKTDDAEKGKWRRPSGTG